MDTARDKKAPRILLIDDNRHGLTAHKTILEGIGYQVAIAAGGEEGLARFEDRSQQAPFDSPYDLVVTDYRMPGVWGDKVVRRVKERYPDLPVIVLSGYTLALALTPESTGADVVLAKGPREHHDLVRAAQKLLTSGRRARKKDVGSEGGAAQGLGRKATKRSKAR